jgi:hypothetical protein
MCRERETKVIDLAPAARRRALPIFNGVTTSSRLQRLLASRPNPFLLRIIIAHTITPIMSPTSNV